MTDLIFMIVLIIMIYKSTYNKESFNEDYLSPSTILPIKGLLALLVILHHISQRVSVGILFRMYERIGYLLVGLFFFYSGYGLMKSYLTKNDYSKSFLTKRLGSILIPYLLANAIYYTLYAIHGKIYSIQEILSNLFFKGEPIVAFSWFMVAIIYAYIIFYISMKIGKSPKRVIQISSVGYLLYLTYCLVNQFGVWWFNTPYLMVLGMIYVLQEEKIKKYIQDHYLKVLISNWGIFLVLFLNFYFLVWLIPIPVFYLLLQILIASLFVLGVLTVSLKWKMNDPILNLLGKYSLSLYLMQGIMIGYVGEVWCIENGFVYCITVLAGTFVLASLFYFISRKITHFIL